MAKVITKTKKYFLEKMMLDFDTLSYYINDEKEILLLLAKRINY